MNYVYARVEDAADTLRICARTPLHRAFATHLQRVASALRDLEWVLSGDSATGSEEIAVKACLEPHAVLEQLLGEARAIKCALEEEIGTLERSTTLRGGVGTGADVPHMPEA
ncbi:hypothetical protein [Ralstonia sp. ASV6]|uniref:hypothetical protein n=1 Tax=Ralstonia sp. ASV6 TaxID=2795124 RepID=UPI0018ED2B70|nr:hypothetical protein [Ralstonia sp. ASV6]